MIRWGIPTGEFQVEEAAGKYRDILYYSLTSWRITPAAASNRWRANVRPAHRASSLITHETIHVMAI